MRLPRWGSALSAVATARRRLWGGCPGHGPQLRRPRGGAPGHGPEPICASSWSERMVIFIFPQYCHQRPGLLTAC